MKAITTAIILLLCFSLKGQNKLEYSLTSQKTASGETLLLLKVTNTTSKQVNCRGKGFLAESFTAYDLNGKKLKESKFLMGLRNKDRHEPPIPIPANSSKSIQFLLSRYFVFKAGQDLEVKSNLAEKLSVKITGAK